MSDFWSDPSSNSKLHVCEQRRLLRDCADLSLRWSPIISWAGSFYHSVDLLFVFVFLWCFADIRERKPPRGPNNQNKPPHDKTNKMTVRSAKTQFSLGIHPVWSESSLCAQWVAKDPSFLHADSEDSGQTGRMPSLIWVFAGRTCHFVGIVMRRLKSRLFQDRRLRAIFYWPFQGGTSVVVHHCMRSFFFFFFFFFFCCLLICIGLFEVIMVAILLDKRSLLGSPLVPCSDVLISFAFDVVDSVIYQFVSISDHCSFTSSMYCTMSVLVKLSHFLLTGENANSEKEFSEEAVEVHWLDHF